MAKDEPNLFLVGQIMLYKQVLLVYCVTSICETVLYNFGENLAYMSPRLGTMLRMNRKNENRKYTGRVVRVDHKDGINLGLFRIRFQYILAHPSNNVLKS